MLKELCTYDSYCLYFKWTSGSLHAKLLFSNTVSCGRSLVNGFIFAGAHFLRQYPPISMYSVLSFVYFSNRDIVIQTWNGSVITRSQIFLWEKLVTWTSESNPDVDVPYDTKGECLNIENIACVLWIHVTLKKDCDILRYITCLNQGVT